MSKNILLILFLSVFYPLATIASKNSESFEILAYDANIKVSSPDKFNEKAGVIFTNETNYDFKMKIASTDNNINPIYTTIRAGKTKGIELTFSTNHIVKVIPLSPAFQEIELIFGKNTYEIPDPRQRE